LDALKLSSEPSAAEYTIAAEKLSVPLARLNTLKRLNLWLPDSDDPVEVFMEPDATVAELVASLPEAIKAQLTGPQRLLEIISHRIHRDFESDFMLTLLPRDANVLLVPEPEVGPTDSIISVHWYYRDPSRGYGLPFLFVLHPGEPWPQTKSRLSQSLGSRLSPSAVMHWISFGQARPIADQEMLHAIAQCTRGSQRVEGGMALGIDQSPSTRAAQAPTSAPERSIRIRK
jgi:ubiquitin carboxyl-terminal hydrolase 7